MPIPISVPPLSSYDHVAETKEPLDWAELPTVNLSNLSDPEEKKKQAEILINAVREKGFFYVKGYDIDQQRVNQQFAIGQAFYELPLEEKLKYQPDLESGDYNGYRPAGRRILDAETGLADRTEVYNLPKFGHGWFKHDHPAPVSSKIEEIEQFSRDLHSKVLDPLFRLTSIALELPEDYLSNLHQYEIKSEDHLRYMKYSKYTDEETKKIGNLWSQGHTDLGTYTLLFRQPVAALQIQDHTTGQWKWVKPQDNTFTVNACDTLSFLTANYIKSTIHRVAAPPKDQRHVDRLGLLYFARPQNDLVLNTIDSPVLKRAGYTQNVFEAQNLPVPTMEEFVVAKQKWQQKKGVGYREGETIIPGFQGQIFA